MKTIKSGLIIVIISSLAGIGQLSAQNVVSDSTSTTTDSAVQNTQEQKKDKKKRNDFKIFGGINFNILDMDAHILKPTMAVGWDLGFSYRSGRFFYWEIGAIYDNAVYNVADTTQIISPVLDGVFSLHNIQIPIKGGINVLSFMSRFLGLRIYLGAVPVFNIGVGDNKLGITKDKINTFNFYGQAGIGVDVAFIFVEAGYNYGFDDVFNRDIKSNPNQVFVNLGFRF